MKTYPCFWCKQSESVLVCKGTAEGTLAFMECTGCDASGPVCDSEEDAIDGWMEKVIVTCRIIEEPDK